MIDTDNWPSMAEELHRKIADTLDKRVKQYEAGKITLREFFLIVNDLYDATSGLATKEISDLLADIHKGLLLEARKGTA